MQSKVLNTEDTLAVHINMTTSTQNCEPLLHRCVLGRGPFRHLTRLWVQAMLTGLSQ